MIMVLVGLGVSILLPNSYLATTVEMFKTPDERYGFVLPFWPGLATYLPLVPLGIWIALLWMTDAGEPASSSHAA